MTGVAVVRLFVTTERCELRLSPDDSVILRRSNNPHELVLNDPGVSRLTSGVATLRLDGDDLLLAPQPSAGPILVNGIKVEDERALRPGDRVRVGHSVVIVQGIGPSAGEGEVKTVRLATAYVKDRDALGPEAERLAQWSEAFDQLKAAEDEQEAAEFILQHLCQVIQGERGCLAQRTSTTAGSCRELASCNLSAAELERVLRWLAQANVQPGVQAPALQEVHAGDQSGRAAVGRLDRGDESWLFYLEPGPRVPGIQAGYRALSILSNLLDLHEVFHEREARSRMVSELTRTVRVYARPPEEQDYEIVRRHFVFGSAAMRSICRALTRAAAVSSPVLLLGEPGTGKQLAAEAIHAASERRHRELVTVSIAEYPETLIESALFGHTRGAFTGAMFQQGLLTEADGSTLFLDEIGEVPLNIQAKLLRVLERGELRRLGETKVTRVNIRLVTATNRDLAREVHEGRFRQDLYDRISVIPILMPPLRERPEDVPLLAAHFLDQFNATMGKEVRITPEGVRHLGRYTWPDNIRGLRKYIERTVALADFGPRTLGPDQLPPFSPAPITQEPGDRVEELVSQLRDQGRLNQARILGGFRESLGRLTKSAWADRLGMSRPVFRSELQKLIAFCLERGLTLEFFERRLTLRPEDWHKIQGLQENEGTP